jgi:hypothetical protein
MLLEKTLVVNDVACIKIANGDEIIGKITEINEKTVTISKPLLMVLSQDPRTGQPGVQMAPFWMLGGDKDSKYPISRDHVVCMVRANPDAVKGYTAMTTGLTIPGSSGLVT